MHQRVVAPLMYDRRASIETHHYSHHDHVIVSLFRPTDLHFETEAGCIVPSDLLKTIGRGCVFWIGLKKKKISNSETSALCACGGGYGFKR